MNEKDLLTMKEDIDKAKVKISELNGKQKYLLQELKDKWQCNSLEEANEKLKMMNKEIDATNVKITKMLNEIQEQYAT